MVAAEADWTNWSGSITCRPNILAAPQTEAEISERVRQAGRAGQMVRVVGTGHSFVPLCASTGVLISLDGLQGVISTDQGRLQATVWAGTKIHQLGEPLWRAGLAMANMGDIDRQSIAGAISTGTHGTGHGIGNISTQVVGLRLVTATGDLLDLAAETEPELFKAAQVSLGALGVITRITLQLLPAYHLHERTFVLPFDECCARINDFVAANRHFEFFWSPRDDACAVKLLNPTEAEPGIIAPPPTGNMARYLKPERIAPSYQIFPSERNLRFNEIEFALPEAKGLDCLREIRQLMQTQYPEVAWPLEYRTLGADEIDLSPAHRRDSVTISAHQAHDLPYHDFFAAVEAIFRNHRGRPHWGKVHTHTARELADLYPRWEQFQAVRQQLDPGGRFLNPYLRSILLDTSLS